MENLKNRQATDGASAFYSRDSTLAQQIAADIQQAGGIITVEDLQNYYNSSVQVTLFIFLIVGDVRKLANLSRIGIL